MKLLPPQEYELANPLLGQFDHHTVIKTILSGATPGKVYIDDHDNPDIVFAQFKQRAFIAGEVIGLENTKLEDFFNSTVLENCRKWDVPLFRLSATSQAVFDHIGNLLQGQQPLKVPYQCYEYNITLPLPEVDFQEGFTISKVNAALLESEFDGKEDLLDEMCSERESAEAFLEKSFGIVALQGQDLAGWCLSEYNHKNQCEVGIATMTPFQKQGLARSMTTAFIKLAEKTGIDRILWHCFKSNEASWQTALSAGFKLYEEEPVLMVYLNRALQCAIHGNLHFERGDYKESLAWYQKALSQPEPQAWIAWSAACAAARCTDVNLAFDFLHRAIDLGFTDLDYLVQSKHLELLKNEEHWGEIITRMNKVIHT